MTPERYNQISELFEAALKRSPDERSLWLANACGDDRELCAEVEKLLSHHVEDEDFLARPALQVAAQLLKQNQIHLQAGTQLKHYELIAPLGAGGMGEVWLARDTQLERKVALKLLPSQFTQNPERLQRFHREARAASALNHPNIITIYEIGMAERLHFIVTEYIDGVTLRQRIVEGQLSLRETLAIVRQMADALDTAHQANIIHRDIKPENVMIRRDGLVKVLDFGLARINEMHSGENAPAIRISSMTNPGVVMGTPRYMSPEQARGLKVDERTDVFSLGVVFYEMLAGSPPFAGATEAEIYAALLEKEPLPLSKFTPEIPAELETIIRRLLAKDRDERYETVRAFTDDLDQLSALPSNNSAELRMPSMRGQGTGGLRKDTNERGPQTTLPNLSQASVQSTGLNRTRPGWLVAALVIVALLSFGVWRWMVGTGHSPQSAAATFTPLIGEPGAKDHPVFSPDETRIAFTWDGGKKAERDIYVKVIGADGPPLRLTTAPEDDANPVWTTDGKYVVFVRSMPNSNEKRRSDVIRVPALGGPEQKLGETNSTAEWSPDGKMLAVTRHPEWSELPAGEAGGGVFLITPETGQYTRLTVTPQDTRDIFPRFSPDGKHLAFIRGPEPTKTWIWVVPVNGGEPRPITTENNRIDGLAWTGDSRAIVFAGTWKGMRGLWKIAVGGSTPERVAVPGREPVSLDISPRGDKLVWTEGATPQSNLWLYRGGGFAGRGVPGKFDAPTKMPSSSIYEDGSPDFSPDGQRLVFSSSRTGGYELWLSDADGNNAMRLTTQGGPTGSPRWSPDGKWIAFDSQIGGDGNIYVMSADGGPWRRLTPESTAETVPAWSRDGQWIYFKSNRSGSMQIHKMPAAGGEAKQITFQGGFEGFESPDGNLFYYTKGRGVYGIYTVPANGGEEKLVPELSRAGYWRSWNVLNEGICFIAKEEAPQQTIRFFSFATRRVTPLIPVNGEALFWLSGLALSADGKRLLFAQPEPRKDEIMLMENFR